MRGLLDTSVFVAREDGRALATDAIPAYAAISVVTLAELQLGVHLATSDATRARRMRTAQGAAATYASLPVDDDVAAAFAALVAEARRDGKRPKVQDAWIAATARAHGVPVVTQDSDFDGLPGVDVIRV